MAEEVQSQVSQVSQPEGSQRGTTSPVHTWNSMHSSPAPTYSPLYPADPKQMTASPVGSKKDHYSPGTTYADPNHPDIRSPGLETAWMSRDGDAGKEVVHPPYQYTDQYGTQYVPVAPYATSAHPYMTRIDPSDQKLEQERKRRLCGCPLWLFIALIVIFIVALAVGLGAGLGVGLKHRSSPMSANPSLDPRYLSKTGAFNGSGIAIASYSFDNGGYGVYNVYFQHWTGQLRKMQLLTTGEWTGGDETTIVATNAKNGTPISAVAYALDYTSTWHLFYIDKENIIRERISDNKTNIWRDGPLGELNLKAMDHPNVGLQACWYGSFYGTANYTHSPIPGTGQNTTSKDSVIGMHLWYGKDPQTLEELNYTYNTTSWYQQESFVANAHAGIGCYSWGPGSVSYLMMVNLNNEINVMWKDLNASVTSHPIDKWTNTSVSIPNVMPNTSLGYTNYFYTQLADRSIAGYNISYDAENTKIVESQNFKLPWKALPGSHFSVTAVKTGSGGDNLLVFDQTNGTDITENLRDLQSGQWAYNPLPIPT